MLGFVPPYSVLLTSRRRQPPLGFAPRRIDGGVVSDEESSYRSSGNRVNGAA